MLNCPISRASSGPSINARCRRLRVSLAACCHSRVIKLGEAFEGFRVVLARKPRK
jgi:hypothetical protein